jgi:hypothetical protein
MSDKFRYAYMNDSFNPILKAIMKSKIVRDAYNVTYPMFRRAAAARIHSCPSGGRWPLPARL